MVLRARTHLVAVVTLLLGLGVLSALAPATAAPAPGATISGVVAGPGGAALRLVQVRAYSWHPAGDGTGSWEPAGSVASTTASGAFQVTGLAAGAHRLRFREPDGTVQWYPGARTVDAARDVVLTSGQDLTGLTARITRATFSGTVKNTAGAPVARAQVTAYVSTLQRGEVFWRPLTTLLVADAQGTFTTALPRGTYRFRVTDPTHAHAQTWFGGSRLETARSLDLDTRARMDAVLPTAATITGSISVGGVAVSDYFPGSVSAYARDGDAWHQLDRQVDPTVSGFQLRGVPAGSYRFQFSRHQVPEYAGGAGTLDTAPIVSVAAGETKNVAVDLPPQDLGSATATIIGADGAPPADTSLQAYRNQDGRWIHVSSMETDARGRVRLDSLPVGDYLFAAVQGGEVRAHQIGYYPAGALRADAQVVTVTAGSTRSLGTLTLRRAGGFDVTVTDLKGAAVSPQATRLTVFAPTGPDTWAPMAPDPAYGTFQPRGLADGTYRVRVDSEDGFASQWVGGTNLETAALIEVVAGEVTRGLAVTLRHPLTTSGPETEEPVTPPAPAPTPPAPTPPMAPAPAPVTPTPVEVPAPPAPAPAPTTPAVVSPAAPTAVVVGKPSVSGTPAVGATVRLVVTPTTRTAKVTYTWFANGKKIKKAKSARLRITRALAGKKITVKARAKAPGLTAWSRTVRVGTVRAGTARGR